MAEETPGWRSRWVNRFTKAYAHVWSWLFDPALLVYRRHGFGQKRLRATIVEGYLFVREVIREFYHSEATSRAASLAYTTLLSLVPLLVASTFSIQRWAKRIFPGFQAQVDTILNSILPYKSPLLSYHIARFTESAAAASTVGLLVFMVIAFRLFLAVEGALNQIWKVRSSRRYKKKIIAFTMLFFWGPIVMGLSFMTTSMLERNRYLGVLFEGELIFAIVPIVVLFVGFLMVFWLVPSASVRFPAAAVGALFTTVAFSVVRWGFGLYAAHLVSGDFNIIYGTAGLVIIFLLAIELMWQVILIGATMCYVWQNLYGLLRESEQQVKDQPQFDLYFGLRAMIEITRRFDRREEAPSSYRLAEQFGTTDAQMLRVLRKLEDAKLVSPAGTDWVGFVPACDPDRITVDEVVAQMEGVLRLVPDIGPDDRERTAVAELFTRLNQCTTEALDRMTVGRLVHELYSPREVRDEERVTL